MPVTRVGRTSVIIVNVIVSILYCTCAQSLATPWLYVCPLCRSAVVSRLASSLRTRLLVGSSEFAAMRAMQREGEGEGDGEGDKATL